MGAFTAIVSLSALPPERLYFGHFLICFPRRRHRCPGLCIFARQEPGSKERFGFDPADAHRCEALLVHSDVVELAKAILQLLEGRK